MRKAGAKSAKMLQDFQEGSVDWRGGRDFLASGYSDFTPRTIFYTPQPRS